jgi:AcrR family transcriptional regulator
MVDMSREETIFGDDWPYSKAKSSLLRSAAIVIREHGPRSATLKNIAGKAGVTEPAIFRHFDGVDGVFQSLFTVVELYYGRFVQLFSAEGSKGLWRLEAGAEKMLATLKANPDFAYVLAKPDPIFRQYPKLHIKLLELQATLDGAMVGCVKEAKSGSQLVPAADVDALSQCAIGLLAQTQNAWIENIDTYDVLKEGKKALGVLCALARKPGLEAPVAKVKAAKKRS